jgi:hypothetical protein
MTFWVRELQPGQATVGKVAQAFFASPEFFDDTAKVGS